MLPVAMRRKRYWGWRERAVLFTVWGCALAFCLAFWYAMFLVALGVWP